MLLLSAYLERATAHVLLGWLPKVRDLDLKMRLGLRQHRAMTRALALGGHLPGDGSIPRRWRQAMHEIDGSPDEVEMLRRLDHEVKPALIAAYRRAIADLDPILAAPLVELLSGAAREHGAARGRGVPRWAEPARGAQVTRDEWLWRPIDRVPQAARPERTPPRPGALAVPIVDPGRVAAGAMLHENVDAELTTMELFARSSYEHPELPEAFHRDMSRQTSDESRHARACMDLAARYGAPYGTYPTSTHVYDFHYAFPACRPGSRRELLWRLLLRSTFQEALSLDGFSVLNRRLAHDRAPDARRVLSSIIADEVFHVEGGLKWSRHLCGGDDDRVYAERERAHRYYVEAHVRARKAYVQAQPDQAIDETERLVRMRRRAQAHYPFDLQMTVASDVRRAIGFTERDLAQVTAWGYARPARSDP